MAVSPRWGSRSWCSSSRCASCGRCCDVLCEWSVGGRRGTVRHENVACQSFHTELSTGKRSHREYVFDLVAEDGTERNYRIRASAMKEKAEDEREPYASVYYTCKGEEDGLSIVIYEHTGIITEAWTNQAGQVH